MKKGMLLFSCLFMASVMFGQAEIKINPIGLLFGDLAVMGEKGLSDNMSVEAIVGLTTRKRDLVSVEYKYTAVQIGGAFKYFFSPDAGFDKFYVGPYARFNTGKWKLDDEKIGNTRFALGLLLGYKWVADNGLVFELGVGGGRALLNKFEDENFDALAFDVDFTGRLAVGYRFGN